jgi:hypothetical protein
MNPRRYWTCATPLAALFLFCGCTTTYVGQKIGPDGALSKSGGVPFVMSKPEYTVSITPNADGTKATYALDVSYVPDSTQRFTLALDPALFVSGKLDLEFATNGTLSSATSATTSRVVETFSALVSLAARFAARSSRANEATTLVILKNAVELAGDSGCSSLAKSIQELEEEAETTIGDRANSVSARAELVGERLHFLNQAQRDCLVKVVRTFETDQADRLRAVLYGDKSQEASGANPTDAERQVLLDQQAEAEYLQLNEQALSIISDLRKSESITPSAMQKAAILEVLNDKKQLASRFAKSLLLMEPEVWRARHLAYIERKIAQCQSEALVPGSTSVCGQGSKITERVVTLKTEWARTLGETEIVERVARIDGLLANVRALPTGDQGRHNAAEEHIRMREERDRLQARIDQLRVNLIGKNKIVALRPDAPKPEKLVARSKVPVQLVTKSFLTAAEKAKPEDRPEFVLVLEPDDSGPITPLPKPVEV